MVRFIAKNNIVKINYDQIMNIKLDKRILCYEWEWNEIANNLFGFKGKGYGFIAQQIELYYPHLVETETIMRNKQIYHYKIVDILSLMQFHTLLSI